MKYPPEVKNRVDAIIGGYTECRELNRFNIFHLYPKELAYPDGYLDSRFFECVGFNTETMQKRNLGRHDAIDFREGCSVSKAQVFADGAYLLKTQGFVETVGIAQMLCVTPCSG